MRNAAYLKRLGFVFGRATKLRASRTALDESPSPRTPEQGITALFEWRDHVETVATDHVELYQLPPLAARRIRRSLRHSHVLHVFLDDVALFLRQGGPMGGQGAGK
jgi:hypothetical protein